jgi:protein-S-isoprenylcysteine O-methyltransferase Ste14
MAQSPADPNGPTFRTQRLKLAWLVALPFLFLAHPSPVLLLVGGLTSALGLLLRTLAAGSIHKDRELAVGGIYGRLRHPLYAGSFLVGMGLSLASGNPWVALAFASLFVWLYGKTIEAESRWLGLRFGEEYESYRRGVPAFVPRLRPESSSLSSSGFRLVLYKRNREWQAVTGTVLGYVLLWAKMVWLP